MKASWNWEIGGRYSRLAPDMKKRTNGNIHLEENDNPGIPQLPQGASCQVS